MPVRPKEIKKKKNFTLLSHFSGNSREFITPPSPKQPFSLSQLAHFRGTIFQEYAGSSLREKKTRFTRGYLHYSAHEQG